MGVQISSSSKFLHRTDPLVTPLNAVLKGLPPTVVAVAEIDVLRTENELLAERLQAVVIELSFWVEQGVTHGFINRGRLLLSAALNTLARAAAVVASIYFDFVENRGNV